MSIAISDLKLPVDKIVQIENSLGGNVTIAGYNSNPPVPNPPAPNLQALCDEAFADVNRLTTGYVIDATSITNFTRACALYRAYGYIGPVPKDVQKNYDDAYKELTEISQGKRPNLPKVETASQSPMSGNYGFNDPTNPVPGSGILPGRMGTP